MKAPTPRATLRFDRRVRLEFHGATITSDADCWPVASWMMRGTDGDDE